MSPRLVSPEPRAAPVGHPLAAPPAWLSPAAVLPSTSTTTTQEPASAPFCPAATLAAELEIEARRSDGPGRRVDVYRASTSAGRRALDSETPASRKSSRRVAARSWPNASAAKAYTRAHHAGCSGCCCERTWTSADSKCTSSGAPGRGRTSSRWQRRQTPVVGVGRTPSPRRLPKEATTGRHLFLSYRAGTMIGARSGRPVSTSSSTSWWKSSVSTSRKPLGARLEHGVDGRDVLRHRLEVAVELAQDRVEAALGLPAGAAARSRISPHATSTADAGDDRSHTPSLSTSSCRTLFGRAPLFHGRFSPPNCGRLARCRPARQPFCVREIDPPPLRKTVGHSQPTRPQGRRARRRRRRPRPQRSPAGAAARVS